MSSLSLLEKQKQSELDFRKWKTIPVIAEHFSTSQTTIRRWMKQTKNPLPFSQKGAVLRIDIFKADEWYENK